jgi:hypothetical protein
MKKFIIIVLFSLFSIHSLAQEVDKDNLTELYIATFDRAPDIDGINYWLEQNMTLQAIAQSFFDQDETRNLYPPSLSTDKFVISIYQNLFKRVPDTSGKSYWVSELDKGNVSKSLFILAVINGSQGDDKLILKNKTEVGLYFMLYKLSDLIQANEVMRNITKDTNSVIDAKKKIDLYAIANGTFQPPPKSTRQSASYDNDGNSVTDKSLKDDGYYHLGTTDNYERNSTANVVVDHITQLMWQDDKNVTITQKPYISQEKYDAGLYNDTSGDTATTYCGQLSLNGYRDWRLPTIDELMSLPIKGLSSSPSIDGVFQNTKDANYWTSSNIADSYSSSSMIQDLDQQAWVVNFGDNHDDWMNKSDNRPFVRCVRSIGKVDSSSFSREDGVIKDSKTGLQWQDSYSGDIPNIAWEASIEYCEALSLGGYDDWRLPNFNELYFIADRTKYNPSMSSAFQNVITHHYWTSTTIDTKKSYAWSVNFYYGYGGNGGDWQIKSETNRVRCVRSPY